jgi:hypothetical protein
VTIHTNVPIPVAIASDVTALGAGGYVGYAIRR